MLHQATYVHAKGNSAIYIYEHTITCNMGCISHNNMDVGENKAHAVLQVTLCIQRNADHEQIMLHMQHNAMYASAPALDEL